MRLTDWLKYVEEVEKKQESGEQSAEKETVAPGNQLPVASLTIEGPAVELEDKAVKKEVSPQIAPGVKIQPSKAETDEPKAEVKRDQVNAKSENAHPKPQHKIEPANLVEPETSKISVDRAPAQKVLSELADDAVVAQKPEIRAVSEAQAEDETQPSLKDDMFEIPELEDFLPFLKDEKTSADPKPQITDLQAKLSQPANLPPKNGKSASSQEASAIPVASGQPRPQPAVEVKKPEATPKPQSVTVEDKFERLPKHIQALAGLEANEVAQNSYKRSFRESRTDLLGRLLDPTISLEETARILGVCPTTVRRYTNRGILPHFRTVGNQRRFRLSEVIEFMQSHGEKSGQETAGKAEVNQPTEFEA